METGNLARYMEISRLAIGWLHDDKAMRASAIEACRAETGRPLAELAEREVVDYLNTYLYRRPIHGEKRPIEIFADLCNSLSPEEKTTVRRWSQSWFSLFLVRRREGDGLVCEDVPSGLVCLLRSPVFLDPEFSPPPGLLATVSPVGDWHLVQSGFSIIPDMATPAIEDTIRRGIVLDPSSGYDRNPARWDAARAALESDREDFVEFFGGPVAVMPVPDARERFRAFEEWMRCDKQREGGMTYAEQHARVYGSQCAPWDLGAELKRYPDHAAVALTHFPGRGPVASPTLADMLRILEGATPASIRKSRKTVEGILSGWSHYPAMVRHLAGLRPEPFRIAMKEVYRYIRFDYPQDLDRFIERRCPSAAPPVIGAIHPVHVLLWPDFYLHQLATAAGSRP